MLRQIVFLCAVSLISSIGFSQGVQYKASGRLECESGPGLSESSTEIAANCPLAHQIIEDRLRASSSPTCYFGAIPIYIDEGCTPYMYMLPGQGQIAFDKLAACQWTVKLVFTFASGKRAGVERNGKTYCEAYQAAWAAICAKSADPNYGSYCAGTERRTVTAPERCCAPQPQCAPQCISIPRCRMWFRR